MSLSTIAFCKKNCDRVSFTEPAAALDYQGHRFLLSGAAGRGGLLALRPAFFTYYNLSFAP